MSPLAPRGVGNGVWAIAVRLLRWTLAGSLIVSFVTHEGGGRVHEWPGYVALAAALLRVGMGLVGQGLWRFDQFVWGVRATRDNALAVWQRRERHCRGHNPLGGWMVLALLTNAVATRVAG